MSVQVGQDCVVVAISLASDKDSGDFYKIVLCINASSNIVELRHSGGHHLQCAVEIFQIDAQKQIEHVLVMSPSILVFALRTGFVGCQKDRSVVIV
eukprot:7411345-Pyramimonas_sp.AAC.3